MVVLHLYFDNGIYPRADPKQYMFKFALHIQRLRIVIQSALQKYKPNGTKLCVQCVMSVNIQCHYPTNGSVIRGIHVLRYTAHAKVP